MDRYGGCFAPHSPVLLADGTHSQIQLLRPGMRVWGGARVEHVLRIDYNAVVPMVALQGAAGTCSAPPLHACFHHLTIHTDSQPTLVTPWHPVFVSHQWTFPCRIAPPCPLYMHCVYNIILSSCHVISINGIEFITLGHGIDGHPVLAHAFFGTQVCVACIPLCSSLNQRRRRLWCTLCATGTQVKASSSSAVFAGECNAQLLQ